MARLSLAAEAGSPHINHCLDQWRRLSLDAYEYTCAVRRAASQPEATHRVILQLSTSFQAS